MKRLLCMLGSPRGAVAELLCGAVAMMVEGFSGYAVHSTWGFAVYLVLLQLSLSVVVVRSIRHRAKWSFVLVHLGFLLIVVGAFFGAMWVSRCHITLTKGWPQNVAYTVEGNAVQLPFTLELKDFVTEYYGDGVSPRQYTSFLVADGQELEVKVNSPCVFKGYSIVQSGCDAEGGRYTVLQLVREPLLPVVYVGMLLLALGSVRMCVAMFRLRVALPAVASLVALFTCLSVARISFGTLVPVLRSWWFVPHLFIYMAAYSLLALSLVAWCASGRFAAGRGLSYALVRSSSALLIVGMLCGAVWARSAWGDYWSWDAKENWAAVTWLLTLVLLHMRGKGSRMWVWVLVLAFVALQITWYGVEYLPSAAHSLHTYTRG